MKHRPDAVLRIDGMSGQCWDAAMMERKPDRAGTGRKALLNACLAILAIQTSAPLRVRSATPPPSPEVYAGWNLPPEFAAKMHRRGVLDQYSARFHAVDGAVEPNFIKPPAKSRSSEQSIRVVRPEIPEAVRSYRLPFEKPVQPLRGFRAPILDERNDLRPVTLPTAGLTDGERRAAAAIQSGLAFDGVLATLARVIEFTGPQQFTTNTAAPLGALWRVGFPVDLLSCFAVGGAAPGRPPATVAEIARRLFAGESAAAMKAGLQAVPFIFSPTRTGFRATEETGEHAIGLLRVQIGSGFSGGILRGGIIDVAGQLMAALPDADFLATVPDDYFENIHWMARNCWKLRRPGSLTLVYEPGPARAWAQDNGKAGTLAAGTGRTPATLAPRYASQDEVNSPFFGGESFLMDGLQASGHPVIHSPLLFQGGNLMMVRDPARSERLLLISETEVYRNVALGLTRTQAVEAFRIEFGADRCVVLPAVSYHLDYDITVRLHEGRILAFVNDTSAAARLIVGRGIGALEGGGVISKQQAQDAQSDLEGGNTARLHQRLNAVCGSYKTDRDAYRAELFRHFASGPEDAAAFNFQCFLGALDVLAGGSSAGTDIPPDPQAGEYFAALRALDAAARTQRGELEKLGWKTIPVPSMCDLDHSLNYLNGLHDPARFLMPAVGGFYAALDDAAAAGFRTALGGKIAVVRIYNPEAQQKHGGLHCVAATYPR